MKKSIGKFLLTVMLLNTFAGSALAKEFSDLTPSHWAYEQIQSLAKEKIVVGYPDGTFKPDNAATRAEFATMVIKALRQENSPLAETFEFVDVPYSHWALNTIQRAQAFDLIKGFPDGTFRPEENVSKAEAVAILISAVNTGDMTECEAMEYLKKYQDADKIPAWAVIPAGKSEKYRITANPPESKNKFNPDKKITRAEIAVNLYNMKKEALINPNPKLAEAMKPKKAQGIMIEDVCIDGQFAMIGTNALIPIKFETALYSQSDETGKVFLAKTFDNIVSKENYLLIKEGSCITGEVVELKNAKYFLRNAKMGLDTTKINTPQGQTAEFPGVVVLEKKKSNWFVRAVRYVIKGKKINIPEGKVLYVQLKKPIKVDLANTVIIED